jgi:hypothetical protein
MSLERSMEMKHTRYLNREYKMGISFFDRYKPEEKKTFFDTYNTVVRPPEPGVLSYLGNFARNAPQYITVYARK